jgi:hypothetical protein
MSPRRPSGGPLARAALAFGLLALSPAALAQADPADAAEDEQAPLRVPAPPARDAPGPVVRRAKPARATPHTQERAQALEWPEARLDRAADDEADALDPADRAFAPAAAEPMEHRAFGAPPYSAELDCPEGTTPRQSQDNTGADRWCLDQSGRRLGPWVRLWDTGSPRRRGAYVADRRHGIFLGWHRSGRVESQTRYQGGLRQGVERLWYESGQRRAETSFHDDQEHGEQRLYFESGQLQVQGQHARGRQVGLWRWYAENGNVLRERDYDVAADVLSEGGSANRPEKRLLPLLASSALGAAGGVLVGVPAALLLAIVGLVGGAPGGAYLLLLALPPVFAGIGAGIGAAAFSPFPVPVLVGVAAAGALPVGAVVGAVAGAWLLTFAPGGSSSLWGVGMLLGATAGSFLAPVGASALVAAIFAPARGASE